MERREASEGMHQPENPFETLISAVLTEEVGSDDGIFYLANLYESMHSPQDRQTWQFLQTTLNIQGDGEKLFVDGLATTIKDVGAPNLDVVADAIHLAYRLEKWELQESLDYLKVILSQIDDGDILPWMSVIKEAHNFAYWKNQKNDGGHLGGNAAIEKKAQYTSSVEDFINSLDLNDF